MVKVPEFDEADRAALQKIYRYARQHAFHWMNLSLFQLMDFDKDTEGEKILVAEEDSTLAGFISMWLPDNFIHHLFVNPNFMKRGIGKALLDAGVTMFDSPATLKCLKLNQNALDFYKALGWKIIAEAEDENGGYCLMRSK